MPSTLICRNVTISGHRTSVRLEPVMWDALSELCRREKTSVHAVCSLVDREKRASSLTAALRVHIVTYFRAAATEYGHMQAGHGGKPASGTSRGPDAIPELVSGT